MTKKESKIILVSLYKILATKPLDVLQYFLSQEGQWQIYLNAKAFNNLPDEYLDWYFREAEIIIKELIKAKQDNLTKIL